MPWHEDHKDAYDDYSSKHKAQLSHELIAGAAAYEAAKAYQDHQAKNGKPASHEKAKSFAYELFFMCQQPVLTYLCSVAAAAAFIDKEFESKGLDFLDKEKAKHEAKKHVEAGLSKYGGY
ncbi:hypothetical protein BC827DRAFT_29005 [Russula dissimulans]|nr:hypothetical protein BC827DRAFT_29005 [Russula dissimulans]